MAIGRLRRILTSLGVAAMVGLRESTGLAPPPPKLVTEEVEWLSPEPERNDELDGLLGPPDPYEPPPPSPVGAAHPSPKSRHVQGPTPAGAWVLASAFLLLPGGVCSLLALFFPQLREAAGIHGFSLAILVLTAIGNLSGVFLILGRSRFAPAFLTVYPSVLLLLNLLLPDLVGAANERLAALGASPDLRFGDLVVVVVAGTILVVSVGLYWSRSKRVEAVFGTRGLGLLRAVLNG